MNKVFKDINLKALERIRGLVKKLDGDSHCKGAIYKTLDDIGRDIRYWHKLHEQAERCKDCDRECTEK